MDQLLSLARAAKLAGLPRGALQARVKSGELPTFDGMVRAEDLLRLYPDLRLEDSGVFERLAELKEQAYARRMRERALPPQEVLAARLAAQSRVLAQARTRLDQYRAFTAALGRKLAAGDAPASLRIWLENGLARLAETTGEAGALQVRDGLLRIFSPHVQILPSGREFFVEGADTLLEAALRAGLAVPYGCSNGTCGRCKARLVSGQVRRTRPTDYPMSEQDKADGCLLMCAHTTVTDCVIEAHEAGGAADIPQQTIATRVKALTPLAADLMLLHLQTPRTNRLRFLAGQVLTLEADGAPPRTLPVASCPCDDRNLQFHVRRSEDPFSALVFGGLRSGATVTVTGPGGDFTLLEDSHRPLVFIALDRGFAPVKSLIEQAMALDVAESIGLYWSASAPAGHYLDNLCRAWSAALDNLRYVPLPAEGAAEAAAAAVARAAGDCRELAAHDVYVAGEPAFTHAAERLLRQHGVPPAQLFLQTLDPAL